MKKILSFVLLISFLISALASPASALQLPQEGASFRDYYAYMTQKNPDIMPRTMEAWVKCGGVSSDYSMIFGNLYDYGANSFSFRLQGGVPQIVFGALYDASRDASYYSIRFDGSKITETQTWVHLSVTVDTQSAQAHCYINGALSETVTLDRQHINAIESIEFSSETNTHRTMLGGVYSYANMAKHFFLGSIGSFAAYSDVRTADEIARDCEDYKNPDKSSLMLAYELDREGRVSYRDLSGNGNHLSFKGYPLSGDEGANEPENYDYSIAVLGDTQCLTKRDDPAPYYELFNWLGDNVEDKKLEAVIGVGDMTNNNIPEQWDRVIQAFASIHGLVRHFPVLGNHDLSVDYGGDNAKLYDEYVKFEQTKNNGSYDKTIRAYYERLNLGGRKFLFLGMGYAPTSEEIKWAKGVLKFHSDYNVILSTHAYLDADGTPLQKDRAIQVREQLVMEFSNIVLVLCGHMHDDRPHLYTETREDGSTVQALFTNPQDFNNDMPHGLATMLYFSNGGRTVNVENYLPSLNAYFGAESVRTFELDLVDERASVTEQTLPEGLTDPVKAEGFQIRTREYTGIRALFELDAEAVKASEANGFAMKDFGVAILPEKLLNEKYGGDVDAMLKESLSGKRADGVTVVSVGETGKIVGIDGKGNKTFCGDITEIAKEKHRERYCFVGYSAWVKDSKIVYTSALYRTGEGSPSHTLYSLTKFAADNGKVSSKTSDGICLADVLSESEMNADARFLKPKTFDAA